MCGNCGKGEEESAALKNCVACKMVKYCSRDCQKAHRSQHKKECRKRAAELHDEALFKHSLQAEECPICFLRLPSIRTGRRYKSCCGKVICSGCIYSVRLTTGKSMCPFCRAIAPKTDEEIIKQIKKRAQVDDAQAIHNLACYYYQGKFDLPQDRDKALELWQRAGELGVVNSYYNIGTAYDFDNDHGVDEKKAKHYYELASIGGDEYARHSLGCYECIAGNMDRAIKHCMIAVEFGNNESLKTIQQMHKDGYATKQHYANALRVYQAYLGEVKSDDRDKAAAYDEQYKYYE